MKKRTQKVAALLTTIGLAATLIGCGNNAEQSQNSSKEESKSSSTVSESSVESSSTVEEEPVVLTVLTRNNPSPDSALVNEEANKYIQEKLGFTVEFVDLGQSEYVEKSKMMFAGGEYFDVCYAGESANFTENVANGIYMPLDELLEEYGKDLVAAAPDYLFAAATVNGEIYAVPHLKDFVYPSNFRAKTYFVDKYNLDISGVDTLEEMTPILQTIKDNEPGFVPLLMKSNDNCSKVLPFEKITGTFVLGFDANGEIVNIFATEEMKEFLPLMRDWNKRGFFPADVETLTSLGDYASAGNYVCQIASNEPGVREKQQELKEAGKIKDGTSGIFTYADNSMGNNTLTTSGIMGAAWAISADSEHPDKAMQFINLLDTDVYLRNLMSFGIEGKHYVKVGENQYKLPEGMKTAADTGYAPWSYFMGSTYILYEKADTQIEGYWKQYEEMNNNATPSVALGFTIDLTSLTTEIAAIGNVYNEFAPALECGAIEDWETALADFNKKLEAVGLQTVIDELNNQFNAWKTANK